ncbi:MAG TPA: hypothetical protein VNS09_21525 [Solirubrobacter sp.]|nr:hypothetical protein [Solirubrobacter sp.]
MRAAVLVLCLVIGFAALHGYPQREADAASPITAADRARGLRFADHVAPGDRAWIEAALARARPEARRLIDEIDGLTTVTVFHAPRSWWLGRADDLGDAGYRVRLNVARLDGERTLDRDAVVLHELGHVIDFALVPDALRDRLAAQVPRSGACPQGFLGDCATAPERFADTFAKWALRGAVSAVGAGYNLPPPRSLEDWGAPLAALAVTLDVRAR